VVLAGGLHREKGAVALTAKEDTIRVLARKMKKCPMYTVLSRYDVFLFFWRCNYIGLWWDVGKVADSLVTYVISPLVVLNPSLLEG
jgi:hypothetical protein